VVSEEQNPVRGVVGQDFYVRCGKEGDKSEDTAQLREVYRRGWTLFGHRKYRGWCIFNRV